MSNEHTPGPWDVLAGSPTGGLKVVAGSMLVATVARANLDFAFNARLIAAAPELLKALEMVSDGPHDAEAIADMLPAVRSAIAKATGQSPA